MEIAVRNFMRFNTEILLEKYPLSDLDRVMISDEKNKVSLSI